MNKVRTKAITGTLLAALYACLGLLALTPAAAQDGEPDAPKCYRRADLEKALGANYGESLMVRMVGSDGMAREIWVSPDGKSFTTFFEWSADILCPSGSGSSFQIIGHMGSGA